MVSAMIPLYQSETVPKWIRGVIIGVYQWAITIGLLLAAVVNNTTSMRNNTGSYRIPVAVQFAWSLVLCFAREGCLLSRRTRRLPSDHPALKAELAEIQASYNYEKSLGEAFWLDCFRPPLLKRQCTGMAIQALQQLSGVNFIFTIALNTSKILESQVAL
ncbi:hypothetical protein BFJ68_g10739 [Fusarium oxysporum]|uniref:Major facilitator superfamily (MFS) profile domain-containing protein n=1 Tax=Fusarium oxysporum TaxID=5507 RepID=A0A420PJ61_FUSOX|nr:hypothetical protein BFJ71_g10155 [Fusarium oxysporum]RKL05249.1 hypothetical protein BFJ68_g10739 [Fusarium oxysporum]